ncbi:MAG: glycoside hydrolase family 38 N-terminal domain-containing protein [Armatimonadota bacterium]
MAKDILLVTHNHFDPTWRRCFDRNAEFHGVTVRSYADIEELCFNRWLELAPRGYAFSEGQTAIWRKYLERNPDKLQALKDQVATGRLAVMMAGETVQDSNMPTAEGLIRNFLVAMPLYREMVGEDHPGLKLAWLEDAFGNSPNYPQVLKGVGAETACYTTYRTVQEDAWVGIDGTKILCIDHIEKFGTGSCEKYQPCPSCSGVGCADCSNTGLTFFEGFDIPSVRHAIESAIASEGDRAVVLVGAEETMPDARIADLVDELNQAHAGEVKIRFATPLDTYQAYKTRLEAYAAQRDDTPTPELNPAMPGCMVSRIKCKQRTRDLAYRLIAAESLLANESWAEGKPVAPSDDFAKAWQLVTFNHFHDAITGTHIDNAYVELMDMLDEAEEIVNGKLPELGIEEEAYFTPPDTEPAQIRMGDLDVAFDIEGIISVTKDGKDVFGSAPYTRLRRDFRIGELVVEADFGDAWGQRIEPMGGMVANLTQVQLGGYNNSVEVAGDAVRWQGEYTGGDPKINALSWTVTAKPSADGKRIDFTTEVDWDTESRRLRAVFPVASNEDTATYEVPFGFIDRQFDFGKVNYSQWSANTLEFPALHWVRRDVDEQSGVAVMNRGLPCYRWMPGRMDVSLLRSPEWQFCSTENGYYEFWDIDGQRDTGQHRLEYSIHPYYEGLSNAELTREGYAYNMPVVPEPPFSVNGDVVVTAWKCAENGSGWVLRLQEANGVPGEVTLQFDGARSVTVTDLLERPTADAVTCEEFTSPIHKHGILTLLIS